MKKFLSFTAVAYESGDVLGHTLAWCSLIPQVLLVVQVTAFILCESKSRQLQAGSILTGQIINEVINMILKRILQQPRPSSRHPFLCNLLFSGSGRMDYGMPSSHAQFVGFFFVAFITLITFERNKENNSKCNNHDDDLLCIYIFSKIHSILVNSSWSIISYNANCHLKVFSFVFVFLIGIS